MPAKTAQKHQYIRQRFNELTKKKGLRSSFVINKLANRLFMDEKTVEMIVYKVGAYKEIKT
jgi:hypothetical protein